QEQEDRRADVAARGTASPAGSTGTTTAATGAERATRTEARATRAKARTTGTEAGTEAWAEAAASPTAPAPGLVVVVALVVVVPPTARDGPGGELGVEGCRSLPAGVVKGCVSHGVLLSSESRRPLPDRRAIRGPGALSDRSPSGFSPYRHANDISLTYRCQHFWPERCQ